jgi:hypothetical protein
VVKGAGQMISALIIWGRCWCLTFILTIPSHLLSHHRVSPSERIVLKEPF